MPTDAIHMLDSGEIEKIFEQEWKEDKEWEQKKIAVDLSVGFTMEVTYYYNKAKNTVVIASPLSTMLAENSDSIEPDFASSVLAIKNVLKQYQDTETLNLCGVLIGTGATERHYVAYYQDKDHKMTVFDSKFSDPRRFLSTSSEPKWWQKLGGAIVSVFNFIRTSLGFGIKLNSKFNGTDVEIRRLGTQSIFDGKSCGYHSSGAILEMKDFITQNEGPISQQMMIEKVLTDKEKMMGRAEKNLTPHIPEEVYPSIEKNPLSLLGKSLTKEPVNNMANHVVNSSARPPQSPLNVADLEREIDGERKRIAP